VAGTIGADTNNGTGMAGINWKVKLLSLKFLDSGGSGYISDAVLAFNLVLELKQQNPTINNIRVTSNSWGGGGFSQALKDAMAQVEAAGVVNVCAAGNSGQDADVNPMYPAAYDNRGIVSVLATDRDDLGAGFTNYGLFSVDIGAPGVDTISTVPTGTCSLCAASGYKLLSGTSMATPHVSGVLAALFHLYPGLSTAEARDIVLDPASYDSLADAKAKSTSSGGRLNFSKTITNPRLSSPIVLNNFPTISMGPDASVGAGAQVTLTASSSDQDPADGPGLRTMWGESISTASQWLFGSMLGDLFPGPSGSTVSFTAPSVARTALVPYDASVADNRGGGAHGRNYVTVSPSTSPGTISSGALAASPASGPVGTTVRVGFPVTDPDSHTIAPAWDVWAAGQNFSSGSCCFTGSSVDLLFNSAGVYRVSAMAIDQELNLSARPSAVVRIGSPLPTGEPPIANATLDKLSGAVPFTVNMDMSASFDPDGASSPGIQYYFMNCGGGGFTAGQTTALGSCNYTVPGTYWLLLQVQDYSGQMDLLSAYVVATPPAGSPDTTKPTVSITGPKNGDTVSGTVNITADASDNPGGSGVNRVEFRLDNATSGTLVGSDTTSPYGATWNSGSATPGSSHTIYAIAFDNANNQATSSITVTVAATPPPPLPAPAISTAPQAGQITRKASVTITATDSVPVAKVDFYINSILACTDSTPLDGFTCNWKVPGAGSKTYSLTARATDSRGQVSPMSNPPIVVTPK